MKGRPGPEEILASGLCLLQFSVPSSRFSVRPVGTLKRGTHKWELVCLFCVHKNDEPVTTPFPRPCYAAPICKSFGGDYVADQFGTLVGITLMGAGCGYHSHNYMNGNGM